MATFIKQISKPVKPVLNTAHSLANGLIADLAFYEGNGTTVADTVAGRNASFVNTPTWVRSASPVGYGWAMDIDTAADGLKVTTTAALNGTQSSSFQCIFKLDSFPPVGQSYLANIYGDDVDFTQTSCIWRIGSQGLSTLAKRVGINFRPDASTDTDIENNTDLSTGVWYDVIITTDGVNVTWYINGVLDTQKAYTITPQASTTDWYIGRLDNTNDNFRWFDGQILLIRRWTRALTLAEVQSLYGNPFQIYYSSSFQKNPLKPRPFAPGLAR